MSLQPAFHHDPHKLRRMEVQVSSRLRRRHFGMPRAYPHAERPRHHHRRHHVQVAPPRKHVFMVAVVALAVVDLDMPVSPDDFRELLRRARIGIKRGKRFVGPSPRGNFVFDVFLPQLGKIYVWRIHAGKFKPTLELMVQCGGFAGARSVQSPRLASRKRAGVALEARAQSMYGPVADTCMD